MIRVELYGTGESRILTVNQHVIPTASRERSWAKIATAIASEVKEVSHPESTAPVKPTTDLRELLTEVDACLNKNPVAKRETVWDIERRRGLERVDKRVRSERKYAEKSETAIAFARKLGVA